jgi:hypothetical protein
MEDPPNGKGSWKMYVDRTSEGEGRVKEAVEHSLLILGES